MRQADEPNGVTEQRVLVGGQPQAARGGIQRREEFIFAQHLAPVSLLSSVDLPALV